jgi:hypothetical protein
VTSTLRSPAGIAYHRAGPRDDLPVVLIHAGVAVEVVGTRPEQMASLLFSAPGGLPPRGQVRESLATGERALTTATGPLRPLWSPQAENQV